MTMQLLLASQTEARRDGVAWPLAPHDAALLAWLALEGPTPRNRLAALLWPEAPPETARNSLRQRLFKLRRQIGVELVRGGTLAALAEGVRHDLDEADTLLDGVALEIGGEFAQWLALQRERRRARLRRSLVDLAEMAEAAKDWDDALSHARELLALEPLSEEAHRRVIRLHYLAGDRAAALLAFDRCEKVLKDEVSTPPSAQTLALLLTIQRAAGPPEVQATGPVPASLLRPPRLVGRASEWACLERAWQQGRTVLVLGEAGIGKSRLLDEFLGGKARVLRTGARPGDERIPYVTASRLLRSVPADTLRTMAPGVRAALASLLPELGEPRPLRDEADRSRLFNAAAALVAAIPGPLEATMIDDLQFADAASIDLIQYLVDAAPLRWLFASREPDRGQPASDWIAALRVRADVEVVALNALARDQVAALVASLGLPSEPTLGDAEQLHRRTGGNPLFILETVKMWGQAGGDHLLPALRSAPTAIALIDQRIRRLSPQAVELARCAALAGPDFSIALAVQVTGRRALELADPMGELEAAQVLRDGAFVHDLVHEAARASVPASVAGHLHAEIAAFLQAHGGEPVRIADHWHQAQCWAAAGLAYRDAAARAHDAGRDEEQCALLANAAACFERAGDATARFEALLARAGQLVTKDFSAAVGAEVEQLRALASTESQRLDADLVRLWLADNRHEHAVYLEHVAPAVESARALGRRRTEFDLVLLWSAALRNLARPLECEPLLDSVRAWVEAEGDPLLRWRFSAELEMVLDRCGRMQEALVASRRTLSLAHETQRKDFVWMTMSNTASLLARTGRLAEACAMAEQALAAASEAGDAQRTRLVQEEVGLAARLRDLGHYERALRLFGSGMPVLESAQMFNDLALAQFRLGLLFVFLGQPARAHRLLADDHPDVMPSFLVIRVALRAQLHQREGADAAAAVREALAAYAHPTDAFHMSATLIAAPALPADEGEAAAAAVAGLAMRQGRMGMAMAAHLRAGSRAADQEGWRRAAVHAEAALALLNDYGPENFYLPELWWLAARVQLATGKKDAALQHLSLAQRWIRGRLEHDVPDEFRDSFLHRNHVNRELLTLAARLDGA